MAAVVILFLFVEMTPISSMSSILNKGTLEPLWVVSCSVLLLIRLHLFFFTVPHHGMQDSILYINP